MAIPNSLKSGGKSALTGLIRFQVGQASPSVQLFRDTCRELPRIMTIFDVDIPMPVVRHRIANMIRENAWVKDDRTIKMLVSKGYLELEEACLQYKTKHQLLNKIDPTSMRKHKESEDFLDDFFKGTVDDDKPDDRVI